MTIFDDPKIKEFFGKGKCSWGNDPAPCDHKACMALRIVQAMEAEIKKGDKLLTYVCQNFTEDECIANHDFQAFHPGYLRLPDAHQKKADPVEEKIADMMTKIYENSFEKELRELVILARENPLLNLNQIHFIPADCHSPCCQPGYVGDCHCTHGRTTAL